MTNYNKVMSVIHECSKFYKIDIDEILSACRERDVVHARHSAMALSRVLTDAGVWEVSYIFGKKDHTIISYACKKVRRQSQQTDSKRLKEVTEIVRRWKNKYENNG